MFLKEGLVLYVVEGNGKRTNYNVRPDWTFAAELPMVVLANSGSASAAEILAGTLQDHNRAVFIGEQTFGKGSVNWLRELSNGGGLYITIAHWYTPLGRVLQGEGLGPDIEITDRDDQAEDVAQLRRAYEELEKLTGIEVDEQSTNP